MKTIYYKKEFTSGILKGLFYNDKLNNASEGFIEKLRCDCETGKAWTGIGGSNYKIRMVSYYPII